MKTLNVLLGSSDRTAINHIEAVVLDLCFERALVECRKTALLDEFERHGVQGWMDLIIFSPDNLLARSASGAPQPQTTRSAESSQLSTASPASSQSPQPGASQQVLAESLYAVQLIRKQKLIPIVAFGVPEQDKTQVIDAGVDVALGALWDPDQLKAELAQILHLPLPVEQRPPSHRWHIFGSLMRGITTAKSKA